MAWRPKRRVEETYTSPARSTAAPDERRVDGVDPALVGHAGRAATQRHHAKLDRGEELELLARLDAGGRLVGEVERVVDRAAKRGQPERLDRQPDLERAAHAAELKTAVREVDLFVGGDVAQVVGGDLEGEAQTVGVAHEQRATFERLEEPLVRIERHGVGALHPRERRAPPVGQDGEAAVGGVDVQPQAVLGAQVRQVVERVDGAGVRGARVGADDERAQSCGPVGGETARSSTSVRRWYERSTGTTRTRSGLKPSARAARATDE